jgi:hypothetical protein
LLTAFRSFARLLGLSRGPVEPGDGAPIDPESLPDVEQYLYFPTRELAIKGARFLEEVGYSAEVRPGASDGEWLALGARSWHPLEDIGGVPDDADILEELLPQFGGRYDGWEVKVPKHLRDAIQVQSADREPGQSPYLHGPISIN